MTTFRRKYRVKRTREKPVKYRAKPERTRSPRTQSNFTIITRRPRRSKTTRGGLGGEPPQRLVDNRKPRTRPPRRVVHEMIARLRAGPCVKPPDPRRAAAKKPGTGAKQRKFNPNWCK